MKFAIVSTLKNGWLQRGVEKLGSQTALAQYLGVTPITISRWIRMIDVPDLVTPSRRQQWVERLDGKLLTLLGVGVDDVFPAVLRSSEMLDRPRRVVTEIDATLQQLQTAGYAPKNLLPGHDLFLSERSAMLEKVLKTLTEREATILRMRFGLSPFQREYKQSEIAEILYVSKTRIKQIEDKALRKLRHPARKQVLEHIVGDL